MRGRPPQVFNPELTRPHTYGLDTLTGCMLLMSRLACDRINGEAFDFGPHERIGVPNSLVATTICELWDRGIVWAGGPPRDESSDRQSVC